MSFFKEVKNYLLITFFSVFICYMSIASFGKAGQRIPTPATALGTVVTNDRYGTVYGIYQTEAGEKISRSLSAIEVFEFKPGNRYVLQVDKYGSNLKFFGQFFSLIIAVIAAIGTIFAIIGLLYYPFNFTH